MKPFNKAAAQSGDRVCTRDGRRVRDLHKLSESLDGQRWWIGIIVNDGGRAAIESWLEDGRRFNSCDTAGDLMMASKTTVIRARPYRANGQIYVHSSEAGDPPPIGDYQWLGEEHCWEIEE